MLNRQGVVGRGGMERYATSLRRHHGPMRPRVNQEERREMA